MKNLSFIKITVMLLVVLTVTFCCFACGNEPTPPADTTAPQSDGIILNTSYKIIRPDLQTDADETAAAVYLRGALNELIGEDISIETDWVQRGEQIVPGEYEILVGATNREQSSAAAEGLRGKDYVYRVISPGVIVITGGNGGSTFTAVKAFLEDCFGYTGEGTGSIVALSADIDVKYEHKYPVSAITLNGTDLTEYTLLSSSGFKAGAEKFIDIIDEATGVRLEISRTPGEHNIYFGNPPYNELYSFTFGKFDFVIDAEGDNIIIDGNSETDDYAAEYFLEEYFPSSILTKKSISLIVPDTPYIGATITEHMSGLREIGRRSEPLINGITTTTVRYLDANNAPVVAYVLDIPAGAATFEQGTPYNGTETYDVYQTVLAEANAARDDGLNVVAAVNGDFYDLGGDYHPRGICVKGGVVLLNGDSSFPFFGMKMDGTPICGDNSVLNTVRDDLYMAIGGTCQLLRDGDYFDMMTNEGLGTDRHPRTAVGIRKDGSVVLVVVDGRQPNLSNGATLPDMAWIFRNFGCDSAVNVDGGGSSTYLLRDFEQDKFVYLNSPSDGHLRGVYNSILVIPKD